MQLRWIINCLVVVTFCAAAQSAAAQVGTIDPVDKWAWSENIGWLNFDAPSSTVQVSDTTLTGYVWSEDYSWIDISPTTSSVTNTTGGVLGGFAWGEQTGYIDFTGVTIDNDGYFHGYATNTITGQISFNCANTSSCGSSDFKVRTTWRPTTLPPTTQCSDGVDNDGDGDIDFPDDSDCDDSTDDDESDDPGGGGGGGGTRTDDDPDDDDDTSSSTASTTDTVAAGLNPTQKELDNCHLYLRGFIKLHSLENEFGEVKKLQDFLRDFEKYDQVQTTGFYDNVTYQAVNDFQVRYRADVLDPWNITESTGYVYITTRDAVNTRYCAYLHKAFNLRTPITLPFATSLRHGDSHPDVQRLQRFLNTTGYPVALSDYGGFNEETSYFGPLTKVALGRFQIDHSLVTGTNDPGYGVFGPATHKKVNELSFAI